MRQEYIEVNAELLAMKTVGMAVSDAALRKSTDSDYMNGFYNESMSCSEAADLLCDLNP